MSEISDRIEELNSGSIGEIQAEQLFIGGVLREPDYLQDTKIQTKHFVSGQHKIIYDAIKEITLTDESLDIFLLDNHLKQQTGKSYMVALTNCVEMSFVDAFVRSAEIVMLENYKRREIKQVIHQLEENFNADQAIKSLMQIEEVERQYLFTMKEAATAAIEKAEETAAKGGLSGLSTGIKKLDQQLGGINSPDLVILGGRPSMGKTSIALNWMLAHDAPGIFFSTEQPHYQIGQRAISSQSMVPAAKIRVADFTDSDMNGMIKAVGELSTSKIHIYDKGSLTISELVREARKAKFNYDIQFVYVDYIQRMKTEGDRREGLGDIVRGMKSLAKELDIPVVALAQVNRSVESRSDKRPLMGDLKDSGDIEQEADTIILLYRDEVYHEDSYDAGIIEFLIDKNRHGPIGKVKAAWLPETMQARDLSEQYERF